MANTPLTSAKLQSKRVGWEGLTDEEKKLLLGNKRWRVNNLYFIRDKDGKKVLFKMNFVQMWLFNNLWYLNIILKARQMGFCLDPSTKVLTADLKWVRIDSLNPGDEVVSVDEHPPGGRGRGRKMRTATVQGAIKVYRKAYRIKFDDGRSVVCTGQHPWLSRGKIKQPKWRAITNGPNAKGWLKVGHEVKWITKPWSEDVDYEDGWFSGMLDGEGSMALPNSSGAEINVCQVHGPVWNRLVQYCKGKGYNYRIEEDNQPERDSKFGKRPVPKLCISRMDEMFRLLGQLRPSRFHGRRFWEGKELPGKRNGGVGWAKIVSIEPLKEQTMIDLQTSTGTYIAEGFVSHNTTFIDIYILDECIFNKGVEAGIIAHNKEDVKKIFRRKIQFPYKNLPQEIKDSVRLVTDSQTALELSNGSVLSVGTSYRSGTCQYLHISEHGKICAKFPDKAEEVKTGALPAVATSQKEEDGGTIIFIESTAEGRGGDFHDMCQTSKKLKDEDLPLTEMDYRFHFFAWWQDPSYRLNDYELVVISNKMEKYFDDLHRIHNIKLSPQQKAWYVKTEAIQGDKMRREYPSTPEEAFEAAIKGAYWGDEIQFLRNKRRIRNVPHEPSLLVHTGWDLGRADTNPIWFFQVYGNQFRFIDYYINNRKSAAHYARIIRQKGAELGYNYGYHYMPHDVEVTDYTQENDLSRLQVFRNAGLNNIIMVQRETDLRHMEGINSVRMMLPLCWFDKKNCDPGLAGLEAYQPKWNNKLAEPGDTPLHNWASHPSSAMVQIARGYQQQMEYSDEDMQPEEESNY